MNITILHYKCQGWGGARTQIDDGLFISKKIKQKQTKATPTSTPNAHLVTL